MRAPYGTPAGDDPVLASPDGRPDAWRDGDVGGTSLRLSDWRGRTPHKEAMTPKVIAVVEPVLVALGAEIDPECWVAWGDDPGVRWMLLAPTELGLVEIHTRVNVPQEGPRASGKLVRWNRVQIGELGVEMVGGHRLLTFQVENQVLRGSDEDADAIASFARQLIGAIDGRSVWPDGGGTARTSGDDGASRQTGGASGAGSRPAVPQLPAPREP